MFKQTSKAGVGMYSTLLFTTLQALNLNITESMAEEIVITVMSLVSIGLWVYGQFDRNDLEAGVVRKVPRD